MVNSSRGDDHNIKIMSTENTQISK